MLDLIDGNTAVEELGRGFRFLEGPVWNPSLGCLLVSDVIGNRRHTWHPMHGMSQVAGPTGHGNGMTLDASGELVVCEAVTPAVTIGAGDGSGDERRVLADHASERLLNSPNDVVVHSSGDIYFTDPWHRVAIETAAADGCEFSAERELDVGGVYRLQPGCAPELVLADLDTPNGLCFGPDETMLYINDSDRGEIHICEVGPDGRLAGRRMFADGVIDSSGHVDGMKCDVDGNVWVTGPGGIWVLAPSGTHLGTIVFPERVGNLHWGGPEWDWLYVADTSRLFRLRTTTTGRREPFMA